ncbi:MAG: excinuclease ABC subunit UvrC [Lachnospiraceae bacterium]|nr:excinuclease ABC subunit UvrC [Lachnospiraceae bacterium]
MDFNIEEELKKLPGKPGVYLMHDERDAIIYIGKAISLKNRVKQYFQPSRNRGAKIDQMVTHIARFEYIITDSELEALVLECNLIKEHRPKYNTMLMDDKTYPYIKVTVQEDFPRVLFTRKLLRDRAKYYGPYTSAGAVKDTIDLIHKLYGIRTCNKSLPKQQGKERPCLNYHIHQCPAPCQGYISKEEYAVSVKKALSFLNGDYEPILKELRGKMEQAAEAMEFEKAIEYRELLESVSKIAQKQKITSSGMEDRDVIAMAVDKEDAVVQVFFIREGRLIGRDHFCLHIAADDREEDILTAFLKQFYAGTPYIPRELMLQHEVADAELIEEWLSARKGQRVYLRVPKKGEKEKLVELAQKNAQMVLTQDRERIRREEGRTIGAMKELAKLLGLPELRRVEAYDISNISGYQTVGSMVVFERGRPKRSDYRKFRIRGVQGSDDYASMEEVLTRRLSHYENYPDLILMDGGKGQVNVALKVMERLDVQVPVCGMVKDDRHRTRGIYYNNVEQPINRDSEAFRLVTRIQDEAHRFAIEYHRSLRSKEQVHSVLDDIPGIGPARRRALMRAFPTLEAIRGASQEELAAAEGMNRLAARQVYDFFHGGGAK